VQEISVELRRVHYSEHYLMGRSDSAENLCASQPASQEDKTPIALAQPLSLLFHDSLHYEGGVVELVS
jgi:hypothetical protein